MEWSSFLKSDTKNMMVVTWVSTLAFIRKAI